MTTGRPGPEAKTITIVRTGEPVAAVRERRGEFADLVRGAIGDAWPFEYFEIDPRPDGAVFPSPTSAAAFVITGSAASVPDREPWMLRTEAWLREVVAAGTPVFGICFGHQILAQALGGEVHRNPRGREMGTLPVERRGDDPIFEGLPARFLANVTHVDSVVRLPPGAVSLARSALEEHHAIRFAERCYGVQFHPEIDAEVMRAYLEARREVLLAEGFPVEAVLAATGEGEAAKLPLRAFVRRFVDHAARIR